MQALTSTSRAGRQCGSAAHRGFTLIEALVALVVLGVGMLGVAALYLDTLRGGRSALYRQQAVSLAADLGDRLRADRNACGDPVAFGTCDLAWQTALATQLPGGAATVSSAQLRPPPAGYTQALIRYTVTLTWREPGQAVDSTYTLEVEN
ncbi:MAG TPA: type IV pilus modification protein PilV [Xanthomonadales bacterium]|nr:type IV pilus modification protein PilV [Xanthomonadales bacterium]